MFDDRTLIWGWARIAISNYIKMTIIDPYFVSSLNNFIHSHTELCPKLEHAKTTWSIIIFSKQMRFCPSASSIVPLTSSEEITGSIWGIPKLGVPKNSWVLKKNLINMDDVGVPLFQETSIWGYFWPPLTGNFSSTLNCSSQGQISHSALHGQWSFREEPRRRSGGMWWGQ